MTQARELIPLPDEWFDLAPLAGNEQSLRTSLRHPAADAINAIAHTPSPSGARLVAAVRDARGGHQRFSYPEGHGAVHAVAMFASWMGLSGDRVHEDLGGAFTIVRSGLGHRHDQAWHTDSTPWRQPNVLTLLGQVHIAAGMEPPATGLLPIASIEQRLALDPAALHVLRTQAIPWRRNFPHLPQFSAPILAVDVPRWVGSVIHDLRPELAPDMLRAIAVLEGTLDGLPAVEATVRPGELVMFGNMANLHRGPKIDQDYERRLVRVKLGGRPE
ncbi:hypothetical protein E3O45_02645 [Cryobacterium sp. TMS1-20-1]|uniref:hypothetical protein n=1 Tax=Cryobacterium sp. TMS1-20-1 TaxID=1259223 RepID=UPI0010693A27|nr:hypothetical protein [Cryobacterium sp. TMS1-20-1]TFC80059.1 hypothetical protein E3O45_02645 [Cryobacterium sp. TMS1-20-1]